MARVKRGGGSGGRTLGKVAVAKKRIDEKMSGGRRWLTIEDGETVVLRFLEEGEDFKDAFVHQVPFEQEADKEKGRKARTIYMDVPCLDQDEKGIPCPGCRDDLDIRYKFVSNVIARDYPEVNDSGKVVGESDQLFIWSGGVTVAKKLEKKHDRYGLMSRDWEVTRDGVKLKTSYEIEPADDGPEPLSDDDKKLMENKNDLVRYVKPPEFDQFYVAPWERDDDADGIIKASESNPWKERKKKGRDTTAMKRGRSRSSGEQGEPKVRSGRRSSKGTTKVRRRR